MIFLREPSFSLAPWLPRLWWPVIQLGLLRNLRFRSPDDFQAGSLHAQPKILEKLLSNVSHEHVDLMDVIKEGVNVEQFLTHFKG